MTDPTIPRDTPAEHDREAGDLLSRVNGPGELHAAVLALLVPREVERSLQAWREEIKHVPTAGMLREQVLRLSAPARLPWFERLVSRVAKQPLSARQALLESTRRLMRAPGGIRPIDRLHWLVMRRRLGELALFGSRATGGDDLVDLPESDVYAIASFSAFLSRMVPGEPTPAANTAPSAGPAWYATVMEPWQARSLVPPCQPPDADGALHALQQVQGLAFMQRPVVLRAWVGAAVRHSRGGRFADDAADALRLTSALLDCPLPPDLARHYPNEPLEARA